MYYDSFYRNIKAEFDHERDTHVGEIENDSLLRPRNEFLNDVDEDSHYNCILKKDIKLNYDYRPVDEDIWKFFYSRYGGTTVKRYYYKTYAFGAEIEAKLKEYKFVVLPTIEEWDKEKISKPMSIFSSKHDTFNSLINRICTGMSTKERGFKLTPDLVRTWKLGFSHRIEEIDEDVKKAGESDMDQDIGTDIEEEKKSEQDAGIKFPGTSLEMMRKFDVDDLELSGNDTLVIETSSEEKKKFIFYFEKVEILSYGKCEYCYSHKPLVVQCRCEEVQYCSDECMKKDERFHIDKCNAPIDVGNDSPFEKKNRARMGITGLQNLGNTCFMSSSIQCLSNTFSLSKYFLDEKFKAEINTDNVLGTGGKLAVQFAKLLNELWNEESSVVTPWSFKKIVGSFQPMFSGFAQHDSAELLSFVLDGLHEDLNRVIKKPYYEMPDLKQGTAEDKRAELSWKYHLLRNQSVIVDMMQGQLKSTLCCPKCNNISVTYDPYMMLSLPIPQNEIESNLYYFMFYDSNICPLKSKYYLKKSSNIMDLRIQISQQMEVDPWSFILCMIENKTLDRMYCRNRTIGELAEDDGCLFAFQINPTLFESQRNPVAYKQLNNLIEQSDTAVDMSNDDDFNNSITSDWVKVPIKITMMEKDRYAFSERKKAQTFPRLMWINRSWDLITVHKQVFNFLRFYFNFELTDFASFSEEEAFMKIFDELSEENWKERLGKGDDPGNYAYSLMMVNPEKKTYYSKGVEFFGLNNYENIPLPFEQKKKFADIIDSFYLEYENLPDSSDDDMENGSGQGKEPKEKSKEVKNSSNDGYYEESEYKYNSNRKVFEFEIFLNKERTQFAIQKLDRCKKHDKFAETSDLADNMSSEKIDLDQCFESFRKSEMLGKDNAWYCRSCQDHVEAMKKLELYNAPPVLIISLKRFKSGRGMYFKDKLDDLVHFPIDNLDISEHIISNKNADGSRKKDIHYE